MMEFDTMIAVFYFLGGNTYEKKRIALEVIDRLEKNILMPPVL